MGWLVSRSLGSKGEQAEEQWAKQVAEAHVFKREYQLALVFASLLPSHLPKWKVSVPEHHADAALSHVEGDADQRSWTTRPCL